MKGKVSILLAVTLILSLLLTGCSSLTLETPKTTGAAAAPAPTARAAAPATGNTGATNQKPVSAASVSGTNWKAVWGATASIFSAKYCQVAALAYVPKTSDPKTYPASSIPTPKSAQTIMNWAGRVSMWATETGGDRYWAGYGKTVNNLFAYQITGGESCENVADATPVGELAIEENRLLWTCENDPNYIQGADQISPPTGWDLIDDEDHGCEPVPEDENCGPDGCG